MNASERTTLALHRLDVLRKFADDPGNWSTFDGRRVLILQMIDDVQTALDPPWPGSKKGARHRRSVYGRDGFACRDCGRTFDHPEPYNGEPIDGLTLGHIVPKSIGGRRNVGNLITQCLPCNEDLADRIWLGPRRFGDVIA